MVKFRRLPIRQSVEQTCPDSVKCRLKQVQAAIEGLVTRQMGKPIAPIVPSKTVNRLLLIKTVQMTEQINGNQFLVSKMRLEITQALIFQTALAIVDAAD